MLKATKNIKKYKVYTSPFLFSLVFFLADSICKKKSHLKFQFPIRCDMNAWVTKMFVGLFNQK